LNNARILVCRIEAARSIVMFFGDLLVFVTEQRTGEMRHVAASICAVVASAVRKRCGEIAIPMVSRVICVTSLLTSRAFMHCRE
jgi:hypothetical protein